MVGGMMKTKNLRYTGFVIMIAMLVFMACNFPGFSRESMSETENTPLAPGLTIVFPTSTPPLAETNTPEATPTESIVEEEDGCTLRAAFVTDMTVPDDTVFGNQAEFVKTWRIRNSGTCTWGTGTTFVFLSGDKLSTSESVVVPAVEPDEEIEISVSMVAPSEPGMYRSNWQLKNAEGTRFGGVFYVQIVIEEIDTPDPADETWTPPQYFLGKTSADCQQVSFTWKDGTGERAYILNSTTFNVELAASSTSYMWNNPPTGTSVVTLTVKGNGETILANLKTTVNVNCSADRPNLMVKSMRFDPVKPVAHLPLTVTMEIKNEGSVDSGAFVARWWKVTTLTDSSCEWYVNEGVRAGKSIKVLCNVDPYSSVNDFVIRGAVDVTKAVVESDEVDNSKDETLTVIAPLISFDFVDQAPNATWTSGPPNQALTWPGENTNAQGYALWITGQLENGVFPSDACLETHPRLVVNGWVQGAYANMLP
ncbi:MAG: hypothetical protein E4H27_01160 [Anaerolineales bacterium]|nr:MAG: hypothetical protein E4H27_01160 [Anaerolineales bacterium]